MLSVLVNRGILSISWIRALREADQGQSAIGDVFFWPVAVAVGTVGVVWPYGYFIRSAVDGAGSY